MYKYNSKTKRESLARRLLAYLSHPPENVTLDPLLYHQASNQHYFNCGKTLHQNSSTTDLLHVTPQKYPQLVSKSAIANKG